MHFFAIQGRCLTVREGAQGSPHSIDRPERKKTSCQPSRVQARHELRELIIYTQTHYL